MSKLIDLLVARGMRQGLRGSTPWLAVGTLAWLWRRSRVRRDPVPVWSEELTPGQAVVITHHVAPG
ncbi:MAG TPA: hypothetical protein VMU63_07695 [Acidimicrobiales bacterium]|nr:hypothetical protein [Acidimicrobiales bacterium]